MNWLQTINGIDFVLALGLLFCLYKWRGLQAPAKRIAKLRRDLLTAEMHRDRLADQLSALSTLVREGGRGLEEVTKFLKEDTVQVQAEADKVGDLTERIRRGCV